MKLERLIPYLICGGREYGLLQPVGLVYLGASCDIIEIWLSRRLGLISVWEEKITLNDNDRSVYRSEYRPDVIRSADCRNNLIKHLERNSDLLNEYAVERIHWLQAYIEEK